MEYFEEIKHVGDYTITNRYPILTQEETERLRNIKIRKLLSLIDSFDKQVNKVKEENK